MSGCTSSGGMSFDLEVKLAVYRYFAETGGPPSCDQVAERVGTSAGEVVQAYQRLRAQRVLVLEDDGLSVRMAPPFSGVATQHVVKARQPVVLCQLRMGCARYSCGAAAVGDHLLTLRTIDGTPVPGSRH